MTKYLVAKTYPVVSFEFTRYKYVPVEGKEYSSRFAANAAALLFNKQEKRVAYDRFNWYYSSIEKVDWK